MSALPPCNKRCEKKTALGQCTSTAIGFVVFETETREGMRTILPYEWRCLSHSNIQRDIGPERWRGLARKYQQDFTRRLGYEPGLIVAGLSTLTQHEVTQLVYEAREKPAVGMQPDKPIVEVVDMRDIPGGWQKIEKDNDNG